MRTCVRACVCGSATVCVCVRERDRVEESGLEGSSQPQGGAGSCSLSMLLIYPKPLKIGLYNRMFIMIQFYF